MGMDRHGQDIIDRYIYDVVRRLPPNQRQDIERELRSLIEDMLESGPENRNVEDVLKELGNPLDLARQYRGDSQYLIGPENFDSYTFVLKIVLICCLVSAVVSGIVQSVSDFNTTGDFFKSLGNQIADVITQGIISLVGAFGFVTLIFAVVERRKIKVDLDYKRDWSPVKLPHIPAVKAILKKSDLIVELVFTLLLFGILVFAPQLLGAWTKEGGQMQSVPIFNLAVWPSVSVFFIICCALSLIEIIVRLAVGCYNYIVAVTTTVLNMLVFAITAFIFKCFPIWNTDFIPALEKIFGKKIGSPGDILSYFGTDTFTNIWLGFLFLCFLLDTGVTLYKCIRYGMNR